MVAGYGINALFGNANNGHIATEEIIDNLVIWIQQPAAELLGLGLTGVGVVLSILFHLRSRRVRSLQYVYRNQTLVEGFTSVLQGLEVHFKGVQQDRVTVAHIAIWNSGTETIDSTDIVVDRPLGLLVQNDGVVLDATVVYRSDKSNRLEIYNDSIRTFKNGDQLLGISFAYLEPRQGGVFQVVHTGDRLQMFEFVGKVKGCTTIEISPITYAKYQKFSSRSLRRFLGSKPLRLGLAASLFGFILTGIAFLVAADGVPWWFRLLIAFLLAYAIFLVWSLYPIVFMKEVPMRYRQYL